MSLSAVLPSTLGLRTSLRTLFTLPTLTPALAVPAAIHLNLPGTLSGIWESILKAVPKKKTSYSKKRMRQLAGKALKDITSLNRCPGCGRLKRAHIICKHCLLGVRKLLAGKGEEASV